MSPSGLIVVSDLDGCLLDTETYGKCRVTVSSLSPPAVSGGITDRIVVPRGS